MNEKTDFSFPLNFNITSDQIPELRKFRVRFDNFFLPTEKIFIQLFISYHKEKNFPLLLYKERSEQGVLHYHGIHFLNDGNDIQKTIKQKKDNLANFLKKNYYQKYSLKIQKGQSHIAYSKNWMSWEYPERQKLFLSYNIDDLLYPFLYASKDNDCIINQLFNPPDAMHQDRGKYYIINDISTKTLSKKSVKDAKKDNQFLFTFLNSYKNNKEGQEEMEVLLNDRQFWELQDGDYNYHEVKMVNVEIYKHCLKYTWNYFSSYNTTNKKPKLIDKCICKRFAFSLYNRYYQNHPPDFHKWSKEIIKDLY
jgi:hypothetical protein